MKRFTLFVLMFVVLFAFSACVTARSTTGNSNVPLPSDLQIVSPTSAVPAEYAGFSGKWEGVWNNMLDHTLVVEKIVGDAAAVVYAWGRAPSWYINQPGWERLNGKIKGNELVLQRKNATVTYRLKNGVLEGEYIHPRYSARATMRRSE